ncbi:MAG: tetratricopeptide repeat protein [Acidobacteria bacterium]|nr:tetratricopeptide repeat protein [Acidobacteriota bacterium]
MKILLLLLALQSFDEIYNAANADRAAGRWGEALAGYTKLLEHFEKITAENPEDAQAKSNLKQIKTDIALTYFNQKNWAESAKRFEELLRADTKNVDYAYMAGKSWMELKRYPQSIGILQQVIQARPDYLDAYGTLGSIFYIRQNWARAIEMFTKFIELKPGQAFAHFLLASSHDKLGNIKDAALHYNKFLALDDGSNDIRSFQARQRLKTLERRLKK